MENRLENLYLDIEACLQHNLDFPVFSKFQSLVNFASLKSQCFPWLCLGKQGDSEKTKPVIKFLLL